MNSLHQLHWQNLDTTARLRPDLTRDPRYQEAVQRLDQEACDCPLGCKTHAWLKLWMQDGNTL